MDNIIPFPSRGEEGNSYFLSRVRETETAYQETGEYLGCFDNKIVTEDDCKNALNSLKKLSSALENEANFFRNSDMLEVKYQALVTITQSVGCVEHLWREIQVLTWIPNTTHFQDYIQQRKSVLEGIEEMRRVLNLHSAEMHRISKDLSSH